MVMLNNQMVDSLLGIWHRNWGPSHWWQEASGSISVDSWCFGYCDETARIGYLQISAIRACCILNPHLSLPGGRQNAIPFQEPSRPMCSTLLVHVDKTAEHVLKDRLDALSRTQGPYRGSFRCLGYPLRSHSVANAVQHNATNCFLSPFIQLYQKHSCAPISWGQNLDRCLCHYCPQGGPQWNCNRSRFDQHFIWLVVWNMTGLVSICWE